MHENNIELLRAEARRLAQVEIEILNKMLSDPGVIVDATAGEKQTFHRTHSADENSVPHAIEVLQGELNKLERMEMVIAVVGTMKAGKSTSINAIVGAEVLPNRNRPMTAIPTLIRHTPGRLEPVLEFKNNRPANQLVLTLHDAIKTKDGAARLQKLERDQDMEELLDRVRNKTMFDQVFNGSEEIFWFLKSLNDLVRLSASLNVPFPFVDYDEIHEFPSIEVEFAHLREMVGNDGQLTLLDTPGPNESGQDHLKNMLKGQLQKASAVLAILDYTQLKSDADAQVRDELKYIADVTEGRLYALVNKFDQKDRNGDSEEQVKEFVSAGLMEGIISKEDVFPVSSKWGYLANRARHEVFLHGKLPDHHKNEWVQDFAKDAFGRNWEKSIIDSEAVTSAANAIWEDSLFSKPLKNVIHAAHARASAFAVASASDRLEKNSKKLDTFFTIREGALTKSAETLKAEIANLLGDIEKIESGERATKKLADDALADVAKNSKAMFSKIKADSVSMLDRYFKEGKRLEREKTEAAALKKKKESLSGPSGLKEMMANFFGADPKTKSSVADFDPATPVIKFDSSRDAKTLIDRIRTEVEKQLTGAEKEMKFAVGALLDNFNETFKNDVMAASQQIINDMQHRMEGIGFKVSIDLPDAKSLRINFSAEDLLDEAISERSKTVTKSRRSSGAWGKLCGFFGTSDWGWEDYQVDEQYFEVDIRKVQKSVIAGIESTFGGLDSSIAEHVEKPLKQGVAEFYEGFRSVVESIRGDILQGLRDKEKSKAEQSTLIEQLSRLKKGIPAVIKDSCALKSDVTAILSGEDSAI